MNKRIQFINWKEEVLSLRAMGMNVPVHTQETIENYLLYGYQPGGFTTAMLAGDYNRAMYLADTANRQMIWAIHAWIVNRCPEMAHGSYETVDAWCKDVNGLRTEYKELIFKKHEWDILKGTV